MKALQRNCVMSKKRRFDYLNSRICEFFNVRIRYIGIGNQNMYACYRSDTEPGNFTDFAAVCNYDNVSPSVFDHQSIDITFLLVIKPENRMLNDGEKAGFSGKKREISGI